MKFLSFVLFFLILAEYWSLSESSSEATEESLSGILRTLLSGPLKDRRVTLVLEEALRTTGFLSDLGTPLNILRLPRDGPDDAEDFNSTRSQQHGESPAEAKILLMILTSDDGFWWPLYKPPSDWSHLAAVLLISMSKSCHQNDLLKTPLTLKPPSAALICPDGLDTRDISAYQSDKRIYSGRSSMIKKSLWNVWNLKPFSDDQQLVNLGRWSSRKFASWNDLFVDRFKNMTGKEISILCQTKDRPLIYTDSSGILKGLNYQIMESLSTWLRFNIRYILEGNVRWTTMTDLVQEGKNDVMINYATLTPQRNRDFALTVPYYREGFGIMLEVPPPLPRWQNVIYPFSWQVWVGVLTALSLTGITFHLLYHHREGSFFTNVITVSQSILSSPLARVPSEWRVRMFLILWWVVSWLITVSYTCNLIAVLTVPVFPRRIQTAEELVKSKYRLVMLDYGEFVPEALATSTHPTLHALGKKLDMMPIVDHLEEIGEETCAERVVAGTHAHTETFSYVKILYSKLGYNSIAYDLKEQLYPGYLAFLVHKNSPWKYKFDQGMQWLLETGLTLKWYKESMDEFIAPVIEDKSLNLQPLSLAHLQGSFLMLAFGFVFSLLALAWEVTFHPKSLH